MQLEKVINQCSIGLEATKKVKWTGIEINLWASVEPSGIQFAGMMPESTWFEWYDSLKNKLTQSLGYQIGESEEGFGFKYWK